MTESDGAGHATRRFFRSSWFSALLALIAVTLVLVALLSGSHSSTPPTSHKTPSANAASVARASSTSPCEGNPLGVGGRWTCTFDDEFNGTTLDSANWQPELTATSGYVTGGPDCYVDNPNTISVSGGHLNLSVARVAPFTCTPGYVSSYQAGMVTSSTLFSQTYGVFEVRAKIPAATLTGLQETFWLWPQNPVGIWPASGEIDFAEFFSDIAGNVVPYVHYELSSSDLESTANCTINQNDFNVYEADWTPTTITILVNGQVCLTDRPFGGPAPFNAPFFISLTQALGIGANAVNASTPLPATTEIDWVRVWEPAH